MAVSAEREPVKLDYSYYGNVKFLVRRFFKDLDPSGEVIQENDKMTRIFEQCRGWPTLGVGLGSPLSTTVHACFARNDQDRTETLGLRLQDVLGEQPTETGLRTVGWTREYLFEVSDLACRSVHLSKAEWGEAVTIGQGVPPTELPITISECLILHKALYHIASTTHVLAYE